MNTTRDRIPDPVLRIAAWSAAIPVALVALAPEWLLLQDGGFERLVAVLVYVPLAVGATLWAAAALRPRLAVVVEDAFGRRSDLANAASGCTTTTFTLFGLAWAVLNVPGELLRGESPGPLVTDRLGMLFVLLGAASLFITVRSVKRRNARELHRRIVARARAEVEKDLNAALATRPPRMPAAPSAW